MTLQEIVINSREEAVRHDLPGRIELLTTAEHCQLKNALK